jgi:hypothetical protein
MFCRVLRMGIFIQHDLNKYSFAKILYYSEVTIDLCHCLHMHLVTRIAMAEYPAGLLDLISTVRIHPHP